MRTEKRRDQGGAQLLAQPLDDPQLLELGFQLQSVPRFHLDGRRSARKQRGEPRARQRLQLRFRAGAHIAHRLQNAAPGCGDGSVIDAERTPLVIVEPGRAEHAVRVTVDEPGEQDPVDLDLT